MAGRVSQLQEMLEPTIVAMGYELWGIEYLSQGRRSLLRIYIDGENGITADDCARVSHQVSGVLDVEDPIPGEYRLEVSSPGMDRPLFTLAQFTRFIGSDVKVRLRSAFEGQRKFRGRLVAVEGDDVVVAVEEHEYLLPLDQIEKAKVVPRF